MICDSKQLKKLAAISSSLKTITNIIYFEDDETVNVSDLSGSMSDWKVSSFLEVEKLGERAPVPPSLPSKDGVAVIMFTSGSTGLPKVCYSNLVPYVASSVFSSYVKAYVAPRTVLANFVNWP